VETLDPYSLQWSELSPSRRHSDMIASATVGSEAYTDPMVGGNACLQMCLAEGARGLGCNSLVSEARGTQSEFVEDANQR
jgi:hypothetical protein